jgi:hypothetical protein
MEHRLGKRTSLNMPVMLNAGLGAFARGRIVNVSLSGALVRTELQLPLLVRITLELKHGATTDASRLVQGCVVRHSAGGLGLEWTEFSPPAVADLLRRIATATAGREPGLVIRRRKRARERLYG